MRTRDSDDSADLRAFTSSRSYSRRSVASNTAVRTTPESPSGMSTELTSTGIGVPSAVIIVSATWSTRPCRCSTGRCRVA